MALYVVKENQELLWNVINNNPFVKQYFAKVGPEKTPGWFRGIVEKFYEQNKQKDITVTELHNINRSTIAYMIENIRFQESQTIQQSNEPTNLHLQSNGIYTPPVVPDNRQQQYISQFDQRQKEYQQMTEIKPPAEIDFREKVETDTASTNMDQLIKQHIQERERELQIYNPPSSVIKIDNSANINLEVEEINNTTPDDEKKTIERKNVTWAAEPENISEIDYKTKYIELEDKYNIMMENFKTLTNYQSEMSEKYTSLQNAIGIQENTYVSKDKYTELSDKIDNIEKKNNGHTKENKEINNKFDSLEMHINLLTKKVENLNNYWWKEEPDSNKDAEVSNPKEGIKDKADNDN